jgi:hypothetical protein
MATNVVRAACAAIILVVVAGLGMLVLDFHRRGRSRLRAWRDRMHHLDPHTRWIRALARPVKGGRL